MQNLGAYIFFSNLSKQSFDSNSNYAKPEQAGIKFMQKNNETNIHRE